MTAHAASVDESGEHPVSLDIDYPDRPLDRLSTAFRPLLVIPPDRC